MNRTVAMLTVRSLLGRKRTVILTLLPLTLLGIALLARVIAGQEPEVDLEAEVATDLLVAFGIATLMPLLGLIAGTGSIGPEIDEGSIVYLLAKPLNRYSIVVTKLAVAVAVVTVFGAVPVFLAGWLLTGEPGSVALAYAVGALVAGIAYCALFLVLAVVTRSAVVIGLIYALVWESLIGGLILGAQAISIQHWSLAVVEKLLGDDAARLGLTAGVSFGTGVVLLAGLTVLATAYAGRRLQTIRLTEDA